MGGRFLPAALVLPLALAAGSAQTSSAADPNGLDTLKKVLGEPDMNAFRKRWEKFVLGLGEERLTPVTP